MTKQLIVPHNFVPRWYQLEVFQALDSGKKRAFLRWHRRSGKDKTCFAYMAKKMIERVGSYYYIFPSYAQGRKILWEGSDKKGFKFLAHIPEELIKSANKTEMTVELTNGSILRVIGADAEKIDDIVGTNPVGVVISEFGVEESYGTVLDFLRPILRENGGWLIVNGTPRGRNHMYTLEQKIKNNPDWFFSSLQTVSPNYPTGRYTGICNEEYIQKERDDGMAEEMIEQEYGVSYTATSRGRIFEDCVNNARKDGRIGSFPPDRGKMVDTFWDLGIADATAIWFRQLDGGREIFIDYYEAEGKDLSHYVQILKDKGYNYRAHYLPHDGNNRTLQTGMTNRGMLEIVMRDAKVNDNVVICPRMPKQAAINALRKRFPKFYFNEGLCPQAIDMLSLYHFRYDAKRGVLIKEPVHDFTSHCCDALMGVVAAEEYEDELIENKNIQVFSVGDYNILD